tara:strand:+ start:2606 stop:2878 length:273 start_codon:yes stop_codon:yes gene_type:complete
MKKIIGLMLLVVMVSGCRTFQQKCSVVNITSQGAVGLLEIEPEERDLTLESLDIVLQAVDLAASHSDSSQVLDIIRCSITGAQAGLEAIE